ncbi:MAG: hypothetical protein U5R14_12550 [Gemmatimonadota bacterium]|nr:hypothetical protein [Gemmatimonadota bacterium]
MDSSVAVAVISGMFSVASSLGAVFLKDYLERERRRPPKDVAPDRTPAAGQTPEPEPPAGAAPRLVPAARSWARPAVIVLGSIVFGMATRAARPMFTGPTHYESLTALALLVLMSAGLAVHHRKRGFQLTYQLEVLALWAGWTSGWSLVHGGLWSDLLAVTIPAWLGCAVLGGLITSVARSRAV